MLNIRCRCSQVHGYRCCLYDQHERSGHHRLQDAARRAGCRTCPGSARRLLYAHITVVGKGLSSALSCKCAVQTALSHGCMVARNAHASTGHVSCHILLIQSRRVHAACRWSVSAAQAVLIASTMFPSWQPYPSAITPARWPSTLRHCAVWRAVAMCTKQWDDRWGELDILGN